MNESIVHQLKTGLNTLGFKTDLHVFLNYLNLLEKWNRVYNLTAIRTLDAMVTKHVLDSVAIKPWIAGNTILDVGAGAGFPGIPLAIALPDLHITLLDSNGKKIRFLQEAKRVLSLSNVNIVQSRAEAYQPEVHFDTVTSRAFSNLNQMIDWTRHLLKPDGIWLAMKGRIPTQELKEINLSYQVHPYNVPGLNEERCSVIINNLE